MSQEQMIEEFLREKGSITSWEAFEIFGITRLSARIYELRKQGLKISSESTTKKNRYGHYVTFSTYKLEVENE